MKISMVDDLKNPGNLLYIRKFNHCYGKLHLTETKASNFQPLYCVILLFVGSLNVYAKVSLFQTRHLFGKIAEIFHRKESRTH